MLVWSVLDMTTTIAQLCPIVLLAVNSIATINGTQSCKNQPVCLVNSSDHFCLLSVFQRKEKYLTFAIQFHKLVEIAIPGHKNAKKK